jgi:hypothetical protein
LRENAFQRFTDETFGTVRGDYNGHFRRSRSVSHANVALG